MSVMSMENGRRVRRRMYILAILTFAQIIPPFASPSNGSAVPRGQENMTRVVRSARLVE